VKGAGTGGATKSILKELGADFETYTFTDISAGFIENAQETFSEYRSRMIFRTFNAEHDPTSQEFTTSEYDLIVASFVIHATSKLEESLINVRRLLKPGGYLVLAEGTNNDLTRNGFIFGTLPGWWAGVNEGRQLSPCVSPEEWDAVLKKSGFSGIDSITPQNLSFIYGGSVFVSQAVDDRVNFLRQPLNTGILPIPGQSGIELLVIVGGKSLQVARLAADIENILKRLCRSIIVFKTLSDVDPSVVPRHATVLSLTELDHPIFKNMTPNDFHSLKSIFSSERILLWVTSGRRADDPYSNMTIGFGRTAALEAPELRLQFLDFESSKTIDPTKIAETVLRLQLLKPASTMSDQSDLLWSVENEIVISSDGKNLVPRLEAISAANDRYNSSRRLVTREMDLSQSTVQLLNDGQGYVLTEVLRLNQAENDISSAIHIQTTFSVTTAFQTTEGPRFLSQGVDQNGAQTIFLTKSLASSHYVPPDALVHCDTMQDEWECGLLAMVWTKIVAINILSSVSRGQILLVHEPIPGLAQVIQLHAAEKDIRAVFTTESTSLANEFSWINVTPYMSKRQIQQRLPKNITHFCGFGVPSGKLSSHSTILTCLPSCCRIQSPDSIFISVAHCSLRETLSSAIALIGKDEEPTHHNRSLAVIHVQDMASGVDPRRPVEIVAWRATSTISARIVRLGNGTLLRPDRTYWLVGLSGSLGLSLCDWMIENGAKYMIITSRNPSKIDKAWLQSHQQQGITVKAFAK
jgi:SAM-dependent methyltransferase